jgi:TIR domain
MHDVFISYSAKDQAVADLVRRHLLDQKLNVFLASISLDIGNHWTPQIFDALQNSEWFFLLASRNALASANVQQEVGSAISHKKKIVPIMWDLQPNEIPGWIAAHHGVVLADANNMENNNQQLSLLAAKVKADKDQQFGVALLCAAAVLVLSK